MRADDLASLLTPPARAGIGLRQGRILEWDPETGTNVVEVGGGVLTNLPFLSTSGIPLFSPGTVVAVVTNGPSWFILGQITRP